MDISQWIGLLILFIAMIFSIAKKAWETVDRQRNPEKYRQMEEEQERLLKELFGVLEEEEGSKPPPPKKPAPGLTRKPSPGRSTVLGRRPEDKFQFQSELESERKLTTVEQRHIDSRLEGEYGDQLVSARFRGSEVATVKHRTSRGKDLMNDTKSLKQAFLLKEILEPPLSLRNDPWTSPSDTCD